MRRVAALGAALLVLPTLAACESTQHRSARLEKQGAQALSGKHGVVIRGTSKEIQIVGTSVVQDSNGAAVVVLLRNRSARPLRAVPIGIDVRDAKGASVFKNDAAGLDPSLTSASVVPPRGELAWINDQVTPAGTPASVQARVGANHGDAPASLPRIEVGPARLKVDPIDGVEAIGSVTNRSRVVQRRLVVSCYAQRGGKVVAAGRGVIPRLEAGKRATYHVYLIGNPRGARLRVVAPPTVLA